MPELMDRKGHFCVKIIMISGMVCSTKVHGILSRWSVKTYIEPPLISTQDKEMAMLQE